MQNNLFANKNLRCVYDQISEKWWFSAVDMCAILTGGSYETARTYWKQFKYNWATQKNQPVTICYQLKMPAKNGKYYFTEVLDTKGIAYLIQITPSPKAEPYRLWLAEMVATNTAVEPQLVATSPLYFIRQRITTLNQGFKGKVTTLQLKQKNNRVAYLS